LLLVAPGCGPAGVRAPSPGGDPAAPPLVIGRSASDAGVVDAQGGVRFGHPAQVVGARWRVSLVAESRSPDPAGGAQLSQYVSELGVEVAAVEGPAPTRLRVHVDANANVYQGLRTPTSVEGKEYLVDVKAPHVRDSSGAAAPADEARRVLDWFPDLGTRARLDEILPDAAMQLGERRDDLAAAVMRILHPTAWTLDAGRATLARVEDDAAVFDVVIDTTSETGMVMHVEGPARVRLRDSWLVSLELSGRYELPKAPTPVSGAFELRRTVR
jgi:hypothetical protein